MGLSPSTALLAGGKKRRRKRRLPPLPRVNGGMNIQPLRRMDAVSDFTPPLIIPALVQLQMRSVYELGFSSIRITLSFNEFGPDFFAAIPYVRAARALGIDVIGIIDQFGNGFDLHRAISDADRRRRVLQAYHSIFATPVAPATRRVRITGGFAFQVLNEPTESRSIAASDYVRHFLAPAYTDLKAIDPEMSVVSAATVGRRIGLRRLRDMLASGLEGACDAVALHIYDASLIDDLRGLVRLPVVVTESGALGSANHLPWVQDVFPRIHDTLAPAEEIFFFDLFDFQPDGFRLIEIRPTAPGQFESLVASPALHTYLRDRVQAAAGDHEYATFEQLVPDIGRYFPTDADFATVESAR